MRHTLGVVLIFVLPWLGGCLHRSPGTLYESSTKPLTAEQTALREQLHGDVERLSVGIGPRSAAESVSAILAAERWIVARLAELGLEARRDEVSLGGATVANVEVTFPGTTRPNEIVLLGAHYDTVVGSPGANDNASGVAVLLATTRRLRDMPVERTVRIVFFVNEEEPFGFGIQMGSRVYAERARARNDDIVAMIAVDSVGYFSSERGSQRYPALMFWLPKRGNFVAFASNFENQRLLDRVVELYQSGSRFPSIGAATATKRVSRSDHAPFWWQGYPAVSMTDTSEYRDPNYH